MYRKITKSILLHSTFILDNICICLWKITLWVGFTKCAIAGCTVTKHNHCLLYFNTDQVINIQTSDVIQCLMFICKSRREGGGGGRVGGWRSAGGGRGGGQELLRYLNSKLLSLQSKPRSPSHSPFFSGKQIYPSKFYTDIA